MAYEVHLGGCVLYGVSSVEESVSRNVTEHDAIGAGVFTIPQNVGLKSWSIKLELSQTNLGQEGWQKASEVLDELHDMLKSKNAKRMVVISDRQKLSELVLLRDIKYETSYQGIYSVSLSLIEYVKAQVKTSGVPSVTRSGTAPKAPDTFKALNTYDAVKGQNVFELPDYKITFTDPPTGKVVNPAGLKDDAIVKVIWGDTNNAFVTELQKETAAISGVMDKAYSEYEAVLGSE
ncbi:MAG TPA: hypothetical protein VN626_08675 [Clostridia bacterium]|nr:hypothetical protein [Clostridia bacterium]